MTELTDLEEPTIVDTTPEPVPPVDLGQGVRGHRVKPQLNRTDLKRMSAPEIVKAKRDGRLSDVLNGMEVL